MPQPWPACRPDPDSVGAAPCSNPALAKSLRRSVMISTPSRSRRSRSRPAGAPNPLTFRSRPRRRFSAATVGFPVRPGGVGSGVGLRRTVFRFTAGPNRSRCLREVGERMVERTASVAVARAAGARVSRRAGSSLPSARFNPRHARACRSAVGANPFRSDPAASVTRPVRVRPTASRPGAAPPGFGLRRATSAAMSKVRHGQQQDAHRRDAPGGDPGRHGPRV